ncbi:uncharacterized protein A4U43_C01F32140 [Asparagus officinalis]|uniref:Uncharacterized protein n=1 Tax=Asparagus officinalis TaxID=4686 RepID=A0A5P1FTR6_ASPOF|nr:uncharacterized protein A4U43_C01F32140 [Asparagus officinalis]
MGPLIDKSSPDRETTVSLVDEDAIDPSTTPEASRHPGKELIGMDDSIEGRARTPDQNENGADGKILEDMPNSTKDCIREKENEWKEIEDLSWKGGHQGRNLEYEVMGAELKKMVPVNDWLCCYFERGVGARWQSWRLGGQRRGRCGIGG